MILDYWKYLTREFVPRYKFSGSDIYFSCPTYADDVKLIAETPSECQKSINMFNNALEWSRTLKAKPVKCRSLAFRMFFKGKKSEFKGVLSTQYSSFDPMLVINDVPIKFIGNDDPPLFKYLGLHIQYDLEDNLIKEQVTQKLIRWLDIVDNAPLDGRMKAWITNFHICSKLAWILMVQNFSDTTVGDWQKSISIGCIANG